MAVTLKDLLSLENYARLRPTLRANAMSLRQQRQVRLHDNLLLQFENDETVRYQVQEVLRAERLFEPDEISQELEAYAPLMSDGHSWTATMFLEFPDPAERRLMLAKWVGIDQGLYLRVDGSSLMCRAHSNAATSTPCEGVDGVTRSPAVHFLRFTPTQQMLEALRVDTDARWVLGCDHPACTREMPVPERVRQLLLAEI